VSAAAEHRLRLSRAQSASAAGVVGTRVVGKRHMLYNQAIRRIEIDPRSIEIRIDGAPLASPAGR